MNVALVLKPLGPATGAGADSYAMPPDDEDEDEDEEGDGVEDKEGVEDGIDEEAEVGVVVVVGVEDEGDETLPLVEIGVVLVVVAVGWVAAGVLLELPSTRLWQSFGPSCPSKAIARREVLLVTALPH